jgi:hypothetical protein
MSEYTKIGQVIKYKGKFFGHDIIDGNYGFSRCWHDEIKHAILWCGDKEIPLDRIYCPSEMKEELLKSNIIKSKVTTIFEIEKNG